MKKITNKIITLAKNGDIEALEEIVDYYSQLSYYLSFKLLRNKFVAEDCAQDAMVKLLRNIKNYDSTKTDFSTFVYMIVESVALNYITVNNRYKKRVETNEEHVYDYYHESDDEDYRYKLAEIEKLLGEFDYQILLLKLGYNYKFSEIAKLLDLSISKVKHSYYSSIKIVQVYVKGNYEKD